MASIKGVTLKAVKTHRGHEGEPLLQGNIYIDNKKAGFYGDGDWGGSATIQFDKPEFQEIFEARMNEYYAENPDTFEDAEMFFSDLIKNIELEKVFKKRLKERYIITARFEHRKRVLTKEEMVKPYKPEQIWSFGSEEQLQKTMEEEKPVSVTIVRELKDLVI